MNALLYYPLAHWCPAVLLGITVAALTVLGLLRHRNIRWFTPLFVFSVGLAIAGIGGLILSSRWGG